MNYRKIDYCENILKKIQIIDTKNCSFFYKTALDVFKE